MELDQNCANVGSLNGLSPIWHQAIALTSNYSVLLLTGTLQTK